MVFSKRLVILSSAAAILFWVGCERPPEAGTSASSQAAVNGAGVENGFSGEVQAVEWLTDYRKAMELAAERDQPVLVNFTGSDWCPPCMRMKSEVFDDAVFKRYANENLVLLELDFPRGIEQPREIVEQNRRLQQEYDIRGFPTIVLIGPEGDEKRRTVGFMPGGLRAFLNWVEG